MASEAIDAQHKGDEQARSNRDLVRAATRRWLLACMAGLVVAMFAGMLCSVVKLSPWIATAPMLAGGMTACALLSPRSHMRTLARDDREMIASLADRAEALARGERRVPLTEVALQRDDDVGRLSRALHDLAAEAREHKHRARMISRFMGHQVQRETFRATAHLQREALTDPMTGLGNRRALGWHVERLAASDGPSAKVALLALDVDRFKSINDTLGHAEGDRCLKFLADVLRGSLRERDAVVRLGGDEFLALMPGASGAAARRAAQRIVELFAQMPWAHALPRPTISLGLASGAMRELGDGGSLLSSADAALYAAKRAGRATLRSAGEVREAA